MAIKIFSDGRCAVYYRRKGKLKWEYFGRGERAQLAAERRNTELGLGKRKKTAGPRFEELAAAYVVGKNFSPNSEKQLLVRLKKSSCLFSVTGWPCS